MILLIDNYDSFTYNLYQYLAAMGETVRVERNDALSVGDVEKLLPGAIILSPGPRTPREAGICLPLVRACSGRIPLLGVCLGHQCMAAAFGGRIRPAREIRHGKVSEIEHDGKGLFGGLKSPLPVVRYHSLAVEEESLPACLEVTARAGDGEIMGLRHRVHLTEGIQFHPESVLTPSGKRMLRHFVRAAGSWRKTQ